MDATHIVIGLSVSNLIAIVAGVWKLASAVERRDVAIEQHTERLDKLEPKVEALENEFSYMQGTLAN